MSKLRVSTLESRTGTGDIVVPTANKIVGTDIGSFSSPGSVVQMVTTSTMPTSHISTTTTSEASVPLIATITPKFNTSRVKVDFFSTMTLGNTSILTTILYRRINGGTWTALTPVSGGASRYTFGWNYNNLAQWSSWQNTYFDAPGTTGTVDYVVNYRLWSGSTIAYLVHQYMEYGYTLTEIK